jgi:hypothetical protein
LWRTILGAWLVGLLADAGRKKPTSSVLGTDQQRALRQAAVVAAEHLASSGNGLALSRTVNLQPAETVK